jgi:poly-beta-hydroxybutyrate-responsive repressor
MHHPPDSHHQHQHQRGWSPGGPRRRWLEPFLLVLLAGRPAHGYSLLGRLNDAGVAPEDVDVGQLYRTLRELEISDLVRSRWETPATGAARREYEVTEAGLMVLDDWAAVMRERARLVTEFLAEYERLGRAVKPADSTKEALT